MQQIDRRKPMQKCDFKKVALHSAWVFSFQFAEYFQNTFPKNTSWWLLLKLKHFEAENLQITKILSLINGSYKEKCIYFKNI